MPHAQHLDLSVEHDCRRRPSFILSERSLAKRWQSRTASLPRALPNTRNARRQTGLMNNMLKATNSSYISRLSAHIVISLMSELSALKYHIATTPLRDVYIDCCSILRCTTQLPRFMWISKHQQHPHIFLPAMSELGVHQPEVPSNNSIHLSLLP